MKRDHRYGEKLPKAVCGPNAVTAALRGVKWKGKGEALLVRPHASNAPQECKCNAVLAALRRGGGGEAGRFPQLRQHMRLLPKAVCGPNALLQGIVRGEGALSKQHCYAQ